MPFRQLKSFFKILIGVQYETRKGRAIRPGLFCRKNRLTELHTYGNIILQGGEGLPERRNRP